LVARATNWNRSWLSRRARTSRSAGAAGELLVGEELGVANRQRGLRGQSHEDGLVLIGERAGRAVVRVEQALDAVVDEHRHHHLGADPEIAHLLAVVVADAGILKIVARAHRPALDQHEAAQPLAGLDPDAGLVGVPRSRPVAELHPSASGIRRPMTAPSLPQSS
jgi:hypothetical protein